MKWQAPKWVFAVSLLLIALGCDRGDSDRGDGQRGDGQRGNGQRKDEPQQETYVTEHTDYRPPPPARLTELIDDRLADKLAVFDPDLVHSQPLDGWSINLSRAVIRLDVPLIKPDYQGYLLQLHPSYRTAVESADSYFEVLPSVNMIDGKAKQFDDGLYAALDQAYYEGLEPALRSHVEVVKRLHERVGPDSQAAPFLAAGLELAGVEVEVTDEAEQQRLLAKFLGRETASKPIGFYTWNESLKQCFQFLRFFQRQFKANELAIPLAMAQALEDDEQVQDDVRKMNDFFTRLTNPLQCLTVSDLIGRESIDADELDALAKERGLLHAAVALFPPSSSRERRLFEKLFPPDRFLPPNTDLMRELIRRIRSGEVDLTPDPESGWYDRQVFALETLLLPERGDEHQKLLMTKAYKKRMLEAFKAIVTKRRETHIRQLGESMDAAAEPWMPEPLQNVAPRLRVEPAATYYLRTARAYAFLSNFLTAAVGPETLRSLHGLRRDGPREDNLLAELEFMQQLFGGLYLISCEDIGLKPALAEDEPIDRDACYQTAVDWLARATDDPDLAIDTRVAVPILIEVGLSETRTHQWLTLGVRLTKLDTRFERPPSIKPVEGEHEWEEVGTSNLRPTHYLIPVDVFAQVVIPGRSVLTRGELRKICDDQKTKEAIMAALLGR